MSDSGRVRAKLVTKFMLPTVLLVVLAMAGFGWVVARFLAAEVKDRALGEAQGQTNSVLSLLQTVDTLSSAAVQASMKVLLKESHAAGPPRLGGSVRVGSETVPDLRLGHVSQAGNFVLVDRIKALTGSTATLFVKRGGNFIRISTNVLKPDGSRAIGTPLDPKGRAFAAIDQGKAFYGVVNILGKPYMTGYEPMRGSSGETVGIWYVGYPLAAVGDLGNRIGSAKILDHGFVALLQADGGIVAKPDGMRAEDVHDVLDHGAKDGAKGWVVLSSPFEKWGYTLFAAYPATDISGRLVPIFLLVVVCAFGMAVLVVAAQYSLLSKMVLRPVGDLVVRMENADLNTKLVAVRDGEIGSRIKSDGIKIDEIKIDEIKIDEIGVLAEAFDHFVKNIRETLIEVVQASEQVARASEQISAGSSESARGAETQKNQLQQVVKAMHEMSTTVTRVSENSAHAAEVSRKASETAHDGGAIVDQTLALMQTIASSAGENAQEMQGLSQRTDQIGDIIRVIDDIADKTNMLALNAAIEAARAGEHGRGFAVVADEVRKLAERTTTATKEIGTMIAGIQEGSKTALEKMNSGTQDVQSGLAVTRRAGASLEQIIAQADSVGEMVAAIATAATEQSSATESVRQNIDQINRISAASAESASQSAQAGTELSGLASRLHQLMERFHLEETGQHDRPSASGFITQPYSTGTISPRVKAISAGKI